MTRLTMTIVASNGVENEQILFDAGSALHLFAKECAERGFVLVPDKHSRNGTHMESSLVIPCHRVREISEN